MKQSIQNIKNSIKLYPIFYAFSADLIFFIPIDTLFLTLVKGLNASQISAITMIGLLVCILTQKIIVKITNKIGNANSLKLGTLMILISSIILTFGKSFTSLVIYRTIYELAFMFWNMSSILLRNDLIYLCKKDEYYTVRNKAKVIYGIVTMITALVSGYLFNVNKYLPMCISIIIYFIIFIMSLNFCEAEIKDKKEESKISSGNKKVALTSTIFLVILSNAIFYSIIKLGQNNSKLFMQYDFQKVLSVGMVTYYITTIVFISRIARVLGNVIFGKIYLKIKDKMSIVLTLLEFIAFALLILGHFIQFCFALKVIMMSLGFFLILAIRDSFQVYIEDVALKLTPKEKQQEIMIDIEAYRKLGQLVLSGAFTLILMKYELIVVEFILLILCIIEIAVNRRMCKGIENQKKLDFHIKIKYNLQQKNSQVKGRDKNESY